MIDLKKYPKGSDAYINEKARILSEKARNDFPEIHESYDMIQRIKNNTEPSITRTLIHAGVAAAVAFAVVKFIKSIK